MGKQSSNRNKLPLMIQQQGGLCGICKGRLPSDITQIQVDHIVPRSLGGTDHLGNLQAVHAHCNLRKGDRPMPSSFAGLDDPWVQRLFLSIAREYGRNTLQGVPYWVYAGEVIQNPWRVRAAWQAEAFKRVLALAGVGAAAAGLSTDAFIGLPTWWWSMDMMEELVNRKDTDDIDLVLRPDVGVGVHVWDCTSCTSDGMGNVTGVYLLTKEGGHTLELALVILPDKRAFSLTAAVVIFGGAPTDSGEPVFRFVEYRHH